MATRRDQGSRSHTDGWLLLPWSRPVSLMNRNAVSVSYVTRRHAAARTSEFLFSQLIPYIGNKRKLLDLIISALETLDLQPGAIFLDLFAGSGVVSRLAKTLGYRVIANDWEPYSRVINSCYIGCESAPPFHHLGGYEHAIRALNALPPRSDWVTEHLCPGDDEDCDPRTERMFFMRKNGQRIDAIRHQIAVWRSAGMIDQSEENCLLAPLLYQVCYTSNTSGVFKGFHNGWGGQTGEALYRIASDLTLSPAVFHANGQSNAVLCDDAQRVAEALQDTPVDVAYLDPPYNQHPYASNYHVLNSIALWDRPAVSPTITRGTKAAIRTDWRVLRRSPYNYKDEAASAYRRLIETLNARYVLTSYSTDGTIPLEALLATNLERGCVRVVMRPYKRYRVSTQRYSAKPVNVEFVIILDTTRQPDSSVTALRSAILAYEEMALKQHHRPGSGPCTLEPQGVCDRTLVPLTPGGEGDSRARRQRERYL